MGERHDLYGGGALVYMAVGGGASAIIPSIMLPAIMSQRLVVWGMGE